jgi:hypothetical protein
MKTFSCPIIGAACPCIAFTKSVTIDMPRPLGVWRESQKPPPRFQGGGFRMNPKHKEIRTTRFRLR